MGDEDASDMTGWAVADRAIADGVGFAVAETESDSPGPGVDVMEIGPTRDLGDIAHLGLTLPEAATSGASAAGGGRRASPGHAVLRPGLGSGQPNVLT